MAFATDIPDRCEIEWPSLCHEAGHVIVAIKVNIAFEHVEIRKGGCGEVDIALGPLDCAPDECTNEEIRRWQQFYAAGAAAETLLCGDYRAYASRKDRELHARLQSRFLQGRSTGWEMDVERVIHLLNRDTVEMVANALAKHRKLSEDQVYELLGCALP